MDYLLSPESRYVWTLILTLALFFPVRQLIWVLAVRRAQKKEGDLDDAKRLSLKRRASATSALLCFVFSYFYTTQLFQTPL